jgi:putative hydrolase of the HAD superfamily
MKIENIKDVFFDLDHTLWDFEKNSELTFENFCEESSSRCNCIYRKVRSN